MIRNIKDTIVYHGSYTKIENIDLKYAKKTKDFGKGFYVTTDRKQAIKFARLIAKRNRLTYGYLNSYLLSDLSNLDIVEFLSTNSKWLNCIVGFRNNDFMSFTKGYTSRDVIIGKIADDDTSLVINAYITGAYGKVGSKETYDTAVKLLKPEKLKNQICFKTNKAISKLHYIDSEVVKI